MNGHIERTKVWIEKADHDLGSAKVIFIHLPDYIDTIAFHCQQAADKYIKSVLFFNHEEIESAIKIAEEFRKFALQNINII